MYTDVLFLLYIIHSYQPIYNINFSFCVNFSIMRFDLIGTHAKTLRR